MDWDVVAIKPLDNYCIDVSLRDGSHGIFDMKPYLDLGVFQELRDPEYFNRVGIQFGAVTWPHGQDIAPATLHAHLKATENA
jgi:hypothetical protein